MSKSKPRGDSFECLRDAIIIRRKIKEVMKVLSLQSHKRVESLMATYSDDMREQRFDSWLINEVCKTMYKVAAELSGNLRSANTIWPTYMAEFTERRVFMDRALAACNVLQDELQYIAEAVYADKNKFTALVLEIEALFKKIKSVRQADNRFLKEIKDVNQKV